jgi:hypothetical protein
MSSFIKQIDWFLGQLIQKVKFSFGVPLFFFVLGSFMGWSLINNGIETYRIQSWPEVECEIIDSNLSAGKDEHGEDEYCFEVRYKYTFEGQEYESNMLDRHGYDDGRNIYMDDELPRKLLKKYETGNISHCFVNPKKPGYALLERSKLDYAFVAFLPIALILALIGSLWLLAIWLIHWDEVTLSGDIVKTFRGAKSSGLVLTILGTAFIVFIALSAGFWPAFGIASLGFVVYIILTILRREAKKGVRLSRFALLKYQKENESNSNKVSVIKAVKNRITLSKQEKMIVGFAVTAVIIFACFNIKEFLNEIHETGVSFNSVFSLIFPLALLLVFGPIVIFHIIREQRKANAREKTKEIEGKISDKITIDYINKVLRDPSLWTLIASNILVLLWAIIGKWPLIEIMWVYWFQSVGIGVIWFLRLWTVKNVYVEKDFSSIGDPKSSFGRKLNALFLIFHYGLFHVVYLAFLAGKNEEVVLRPIYFMALIFFANQLFSFIYHKDWSNTKPVKYGKLVFMPYLRIVPMHITIIGASILKDKLNINLEHTLVIVIFLVLKTVADVSMYINIRKGLTYTARSKQP